MKVPFLFLLSLCVVLEPGQVSGQALDLAGSWKATAQLTNGETSEAVISFSRNEDEQWVGQVRTEDWEEPLSSVEVDGKDVALKLEISSDDTELRIHVAASEKGSGLLEGTWKATNLEDDEVLSSGSWKAVKVPESVSIVGKWRTTVGLPDGEEREGTCRFETNDEGLLSGYSESEERGRNDFEKVTYEGTSLTIALNLTRDEVTVPVRIEAELKNDDLLEGKWVIRDEDGEERASGSWKAERVVVFKVAGKWDVTAELDDERELESVYTFERDGEKFTGHAESDGRRLDFESVSVEGKEVTVTMKTEVNGNPIEIRVLAEAETSNKLVGRWLVPGEDGEEAASGDWVALRQQSAQEAAPETPKPSVLGDWNLLVKFGETETDYVVVLKEGEEGELTGVLVSPRSGEHPFDSVSFSPDESAIDMKITREYEGNEFALHYTGKLSSEGKLAGEVSIVGNDEFKGSWTAERKSDDDDDE